MTSLGMSVLCIKLIKLFPSLIYAISHLAALRKKAGQMGFPLGHRR